MPQSVFFTILNLTTCVFGQVTNNENLKRLRDLKIALITGSNIVIENGLINPESSHNVINLLNDRGQIIETRFGSVKKGDAILVLEAMKMENVLKSPTDGVIKKIAINKGVAVEKNQVLIQF